MNQKIYTVKEHLLGKERTIAALYERFVELAQGCGPFEYVVGKDGIAFKGRRRNFAVAKPKARWLDGVFVCRVFTRPADSHDRSLHTEIVWKPFSCDGTRSTG